MEFEQSTQTNTSPEISDTDRLLASTKKVTIDPIHGDIRPEDMPDEYIANQHIVDAPIPNVANDTESTSAVSASSNTTQSPYSTRARSIIIVAVIVAIAAALILARSAFFGH